MKIKNLKYIIPVTMLVFASSCKKTLDINDNPNDPVTLEASRLLPNVERNLGDCFSVGGSGARYDGTVFVGGIGEVLEVYTHRITTREEPDQYGATGNEFYINNTWSNVYLEVVSNLEVIIAESTEKGNPRYAGIGKILKAYTFSLLVDIFGDVPYSEINQLKQGVYPKFDQGKDIYPQLFTLLDEGISEVRTHENDNVTIPALDDVIYKGDTTKWIKAANTIKLKLYNQLRKVQDVSAEVSTILNSGKIISSASEDFLVPCGPNGATDDRNTGYDDYKATQRSQHISPWFYEILKGYNPNINTGIEDPRIPYYIYNQLTPNETGGTIGFQTEYRDGAFVSIYFGSVGQDRDRNQQNNISVLGIYPVGGRYDDGSGATANTNSGTGAAPYRFITYADRLYIEAELIQAGVIAGDAKAKFQAAVEESFNQVDYIIKTYVNPTQTVPTLAGTNAVQNYVDDIMANFDAASATKKMEYIITQKWISSFGSSVDAYTDYRRTGFPILFDPKNPQMAPGGFVQPPIDGNPDLPGAQKPVPVLLSLPYPASLPWDEAELTANPNAPDQKTPGTFKVFWMP
ncbi:SusD/RagB family nutrient-binding outer membrane lipoprotein [Foetidibacter luteolus]|uniref:SusD/RagB family nutrient-binding outer membrane lipoprotein n=1 Tax=Foetidibacter luteolus TaxID=2608880 RepID=UPI00129BFAB5|nr:SusD/RagB family nutrient-binding outer membrane lipoprotein [Foetidibacter luteolus]